MGYLSQFLNFIMRSIRSFDEFIIGRRLLVLFLSFVCIITILFVGMFRSSAENLLSQSTLYSQIKAEGAQIAVLLFGSLLGAIVRFVKNDGKYSLLDWRIEEHKGVLIGRFASVSRGFIISFVVYCAIKSKLIFYLFASSPGSVQVEFDLYRLILLGFVCGIASSRIVSVAEGAILRKIDHFHPEHVERGVTKKVDGDRDG